MANTLQDEDADDPNSMQQLKDSLSKLMKKKVSLIVAQHQHSKMSLYQIPALAINRVVW